MSQSTARRRGGRHVRRKTAQNNRIYIIALVVGLLIIMLAVGISLTRNVGATVGEQFPEQTSNPHIQDVTTSHEAYISNPPTSGPHINGTAPWGVQAQPLPDELTVHNLEHGGVIIHYRQDLDQATVDQISSLTRELQQQNPCIITVPRPADKLNVPIAMTAWRYLLELESFDGEAMRSFFRTHVGRGPEPICRP